MEQDTDTGRGVTVEEDARLAGLLTNARVEEPPEGGASFRLFLPDALDATDAVVPSGGGAAAPVEGYRALGGPVAVEGGTIVI